MILLIHVIMQSTIHVAAGKCMKSCSYRSKASGQSSDIKHQNVRKCDLIIDFDWGTIPIVTGQMDLSISGFIKKHYYVAGSSAGGTTLLR